MKPEKFENRSFVLQGGFANLTILVAVLVMLFPNLCQAGTWIPFGPKSYTRGTGIPVTMTDAFTLLNPGTQYTLKAFNGGLQNTSTELVSSSIVTLNGVQILGTNNFNQNVTEVDIPITPQASNTLSVQVRGQPGGVLTIEIIGVDNDVPLISEGATIPPNSAGWYRAPVTLNFACSDRTSGISSCPSPVLVSTEGANQIVSGTAADLAGNTAAASLAVNIDMTPPNIIAIVNPPPDAGGWNSSNVTVSFACSDALSGVAACPSPVYLTTEGANQNVTGTVTDLAGNVAAVNVTVNISTSFFTVRSYQGKCLDFGTSPSGNGATVFLNDCAAAHPIRVEEIDSRHDVVLHAGNQVIGIYNPTVITNGGTPPPPPTEYPLQLQNPASLLTPESRNQIFALDGDSIILSFSRLEPAVLANPVIVVQIQNARGANGSPLVAAARNLADNEFWDFNAIDGSGQDPTSGFIRVEDSDPLAARQHFLDAISAVNQIAQNNAGAAWGSVIQITDSAGFIDLSMPSATTIPSNCSPAYICDSDGVVHDIFVPTGVTIRGDRRGTHLGPQLVAQYQTDSYTIFAIFGPTDPTSSAYNKNYGDYVRITGLRLKGPMSCVDDDLFGLPDICHQPTAEPSVQAIQVGGDFDLEHAPIYIDHNDMSDWTEAAVHVESGLGFAGEGSCVGIVPDLTLNNRLRVYRNFIHHNERDSLGYGIETGHGGTVSIFGNTFLMNRHAIAGGGESHEQYAASYNLVLSKVPIYDGNREQDFDMHGTSLASKGYAAYAGSEVDIYSNTFLGGGRDNFFLRGEPCDVLLPGLAVDTFSYNVSMDTYPVEIVGYDRAIDNQVAITGPAPSSAPYVNLTGNQYASDNPANRLGVGDFDGDRADDLFFATGSAWYYAPHAQAEWRFLSAKNETIDRLLLGDFDGDGRTDVATIDAQGHLVVSWGGISDWELLNSAVPTASISDLAVGDFNGDRRSDLFYADGSQWFVSLAGSGLFNPVNSSSFRVKDLRFGHFAICGSGTETDLFGIEQNGWHVSCAASGSWTPLPMSLTSSLDGLVIADFDGDGNADVAQFTPNLGESLNWTLSHDGAQGWATLQSNSTSQCTISLISSLDPLVSFPGIGRFSGGPAADILVWNSDRICMIPGGTSPGALGDPQPYSRQEMR